MKKLLYVVFFGLMVGSCEKDSSDQNSERITKVSSNNDERILYHDEDSLIGIEEYNPQTQKKSDLSFKYLATVKPPKIDGSTLRATHLSFSATKNLVYVSYNTEGNTYLGGVDIIDISNNKKPSILTTLKFESTDVSALHYSDDTDKLYLATASDDEGYNSPAILEVLSLANGRYSSSTSVRNAVSSYVTTDVKCIDNTVYVTSGNTGGIYTANQNGNSVSLLKVIADARSIAYNSSYIAVMAGTPGVIYLFNRSNNSFHTSYNVGGANIAESKSHIEMDENYIYMAAGDAGTKVIDINSGATIFEVGIPEDKNISDALKVANTVVPYDNGTWIFTGNGEHGVNVAKIEDGSSVNVIGKLKLKQSKSINYLMIADDLLLIARGKEGFIIAQIIKD